MLRVLFQKGVLPSRMGVILGGNLLEMRDKLYGSWLDRSLRTGRIKHLGERGHCYDGCPAEGQRRGMSAKWKGWPQLGTDGPSIGTPEGEEYPAQVQGGSESW